MNSITGAILILAGVVAGAGHMDVLGLALGVAGVIYLVAELLKRMFVEVPDSDKDAKPT